MKIPSIDRIHVLCAAGVLLAGAACFLCWREANSARLALDQLRAKSGGGISRQDVAGLASQVAAMKQTLAQYAKRTPYTTNIGALLTDLDADIPSEARADREVVMKPSVTGARLTRTPTVLRTNCSWAEAVALVEAIEHYSCMTRVGRLALEKREPGTPGPLAVEVEFTLFSQSREEALR